MHQLGRRNQSDEDYLYLDAALDKNDLLEISLDDKLPIEKDFLQWRNLRHTISSVIILVTIVTLYRGIVITC